MFKRNLRSDKVAQHYKKIWGISGRNMKFTDGPIGDLPKGFKVLEFQPHSGRSMWTYATCGMSQENDETSLELHIFSENRCPELAEILTAVAHFHRTEHKLGVGHTVNFGRSWNGDSLIEYGLVSLPYLDGPDLENFTLVDGTIVKCLWLVPIYKQEVDFKKVNGLEALELLFESEGFNYLDPYRDSVC